jgi:hypothetical protein
MRRLFTQHPSSIGESYVQHLRQATRFGLLLVSAGMACLVHALLPFLFVDAASRTVRTLYEQMSDRTRAG